MFDFITIGGATRDMIFLTEKGVVIETPDNLTQQKVLGFEYGAKIRSEEFYMDFGGGACNAAISFAKMGLDAAVMCKVGGDEIGKSVIENLHNHNIDTSLVQTEESKNSAVSFVVVNCKNGEHDRVIFTHRGAAEAMRVSADDLQKGKWIYLTALYQNWKNNLQKIAPVLQEGKTKFAWNPGVDEIKNGRKRIIDMMKFTEVFIVNKDEAIELSQKDKDIKLTQEQLNDPVELINLIKSWGAAVVVITDGENGAYVSNGEKILHAEAFAVEKVDTTGAGDAFGSAFVAGYSITNDLEEALKFGILNSGGVVGKFGAEQGIMTRAEIESGLDNVKITQIK